MNNINPFKDDISHKTHKQEIPDNNLNPLDTRTEQTKNLKSKALKTLAGHQDASAKETTLPKKSILKVSYTKTEFSQKKLVHELDLTAELPGGVKEWESLAPRDIAVKIKEMTPKDRQFYQKGLLKLVDAKIEQIENSENTQGAVARIGTKIFQRAKNVGQTDIELLENAKKSLIGQTVGKTAEEIGAKPAEGLKPYQRVGIRKTREEYNEYRDTRMKEKAAEDAEFKMKPLATNRNATVENLNQGLNKARIIYYTSLQKQNPNLKIPKINTTQIKAFDSYMQTVMDKLSKEVPLDVTGEKIALLLLGEIGSNNKKTVELTKDDYEFEYSRLKSAIGRDSSLVFHTDKAALDEAKKQLDAGVEEVPVSWEIFPTSIEGELTHLDDICAVVDLMCKDPSFVKWVDSQVR